MIDPRIRWPAIVLTLLVASACSTVETFDRSRTVIEPDDYILAVAFDTSALSARNGGPGRWEFDGVYIFPYGATPVAIAGSEPGLTLIMVDTPSKKFAFGDIKLYRRVGHEGLELYEIEVPGPEIVLEPGTVNYVGTLIVKDVFLGDVTGRPTAAQIRVEDRWDTESAAWQKVYPVLENRDPVRNIAANQEVEALVDLDRSGNQSADDSLGPLLGRRQIPNPWLAATPGRSRHGPRPKKN